MVAIKLICCGCGKTKSRDVEALPILGIGLTLIVQSAGWVPAFDMKYQRTLVFCSTECRDNSLTKKGTFKKRLPYDKYPAGRAALEEAEGAE